MEEKRVGPDLITLKLRSIDLGVKMWTWGRGRHSAEHANRLQSTVVPASVGKDLYPGTREGAASREGTLSSLPNWSAHLARGCVGHAFHTSCCWCTFKQISLFESHWPHL